MTYQLSANPSIGIIRHNDDGTASYIPDCADNTDWQEYQLWLGLGNTPEAA